MRSVKNSGLSFAVLCGFLAALCVTYFSFIASPAHAGSAPGFRLGPRVTLLDNNALGLRYFPDEAVAVVQRNPTMRLILAGGVSSYLVEGAAIDRLTTSSRLLGPGKPGTFDNGYAGIGGCWRATGGELYAFYHAEDHEGLPRLPNGAPGFYASIGLGRMDQLASGSAIFGADGGVRTARISRLGPCLTGPFPKDLAGRTDQGIGEMCVVPDRAGKFLYVYFTDHAHENGRGVQIGLARADLSKGPPLPGHWKKYINGNFSEPGLGGHASPVLSAAAMKASALFPNVTWSAALGKFVMFLNIQAWDEVNSDAPPRVSGIYYATSTDGLAWSEPVQLLKEWSISRLDRPVAWHPTVIWDEEDGRSGQGWLVYGYSPSWGFPNRQHPARRPHYLVGHRISVR